MKKIAISSIEPAAALPPSPKADHMIRNANAPTTLNADPQHATTAVMLRDFLENSVHKNNTPLTAEQIVNPDPHAAWVAVDFDGTLAEYEKFISPFHIGDPIAEMCEAVLLLLEFNIPVKIFTARICPVAMEMNAAQYHMDADDLLAQVISAIQDFTEKHLYFRLPVTNIKTYSCIGFIDDRAIPVHRNNGILMVNGQELGNLLPQVF